MTVRLMKEGRELWPVFAATVLFIAVPYLIWGQQAGSCGMVAFGLGCAVMGASAFGNEFHHRTFPLLLSQPIARPALWCEKMGVLALGMLASLGVSWACLERFSGVEMSKLSGLGPLVGALVWAICTTPFWTLLLRSGIAGAVFAVIVPSLLLPLSALVSGRWFRGVGEEWIILVVGGGYCALTCWMGYRQFNRLQILDASAPEVRLPAALENLLDRFGRKVFGGFAGPFASLVAKEVRLQRMSFLLAGLFCLVVVAAACLSRSRNPSGEVILGLDFTFYLLILPLLAGAIAVAEEKAWGVADWHLTLPPSALKQWSAKMLVTLATSVGLGLLLPAGMLILATMLAGRGLFFPNSRGFLPPFPVMLILSLWQLLLLQVAVYVGSCCRSTFKAILLAFAMVMAGLCLCFLSWIKISHLIRGDSASLEPLLSSEWQGLAGMGLLALLGGLQWFAFANYRQSGGAVPGWSRLGQGAAVLVIVGLFIGLLLMLSGVR